MIKKKKKNVTIEDLAGMVQRGFSDLGVEVREVKQGQKNIEKRMDTLERGQEDIKLSLNNVAYRFELKQLDERVTSLERKIAKA